MTNDHEFLADEISRTSGCAHWGSYGRCEASESEHFAAQPETQPTSSTLKQRLVDYYNEKNHRTDSNDAGCTHTSGWHKEDKPCFNCGATSAEVIDSTEKPQEEMVFVLMDYSNLPIEKARVACEAILHWQRSTSNHVTSSDESQLLTDMSMLIRRMARKLVKHGESELDKQALEFLDRKGAGGSVLREIFEPGGKR